MTTAIIIFVHATFLAIGFFAGIGWEKWSVHERERKRIAERFHQRRAAAQRARDWADSI